MGIFGFRDNNGANAPNGDANTQPAQAGPTEAVNANVVPEPGSAADGQTQPSQPEEANDPQQSGTESEADRLSIRGGASLGLHMPVSTTETTLKLGGLRAKFPEKSANVTLE